MKALIWKELKEMRWGWLSMLGFLIILIPFTGRGDDIVYPLLAGISVLLYSWYLGARSFSIEYTHQTMEYLQTRPIHPSRILLVKYVSGIVQIFLLLLLGSLIATYLTEGKSGVLISDYISFLTNFSFWALVMAIFIQYSIFFLCSLICKDTLRSLLIGFLFQVILNILVYVFYFSKNTKILAPFLIDSSYLSLITGIYQLVCIEIFIISLLGIIFYWIYYRRFIWKTSYWVLILLSIFFMVIVSPLINGRINSIYETDEYKLSGDDLHVVGKYLYYFKWDRTKEQLIGVNIDNPLKPEMKIVGMIPNDYGWPRFEGKYIYCLQKNQNKQEFVVYDFTTTVKPVEIKRLLVSEDTGSFSNTESKGEYVYLNYSQRTGIIYQDKFNHPTSKEKSSYPNNVFLYRYHLIQISKKTWEIVNQYDINSVQNRRYYSFWIDTAYQNIYYHRTLKGIEIYPLADFLNSTNPVARINFPDSNFIFTVQDHYLYLASSRKALEIYDISNMNNPRKISSVDWDWVEKMDSPKKLCDPKYFYSLPYAHIVLTPTRAMVFYNRGFSVFDITYPQKPLLLGKMNTDIIRTVAHDEHYLYTSGALRDFAIYRIP